MQTTVVTSIEPLTPLYGVAHYVELLYIGVGIMHVPATLLFLHHCDIVIGIIGSTAVISFVAHLCKRSKSLMCQYTCTLYHVDDSKIVTSERDL